MPDELCDTEGSPSIAGGRLNPKALEWPFSQQAAVPNTIESHTTGETEVLKRGFPMSSASHA